MSNYSIKQRFIFLLMVDSCTVMLSVFLGYLILIPYMKSQTISVLLLIAFILVSAHHLFAYIFNLYHRAWEYASIDELLLIVKSVTCSVFATMVIMSLITWSTSLLRLYFIVWMILLIMIGGSRLFWRVYRRVMINAKDKKIPTMVVGAGQGGSIVIRHMLNSSSIDMEPVLVVDDDINKQNMTLVEGVKVQGTTNDIPTLVRKYHIEKVVIAIPTLTKKRLQEIICITKETEADVLIMPSIEQILSGNLPVYQLKKIEVEDLLGREPVELDMHQISNLLSDKVVLVTGAGGSIGSEICRQVLQFKPKQLILLGHGENSIYLIHQALLKMGHTSTQLIPIIADIQDRQRMEEIMKCYRPYAVYHAAAHKHVPLMEWNPEEAVKNNILGTKYTAEAAQKAQVKKFVMISTDKAVNPSNVMGASKRIAEMIIQNLNNPATVTDFITVRFGNVLGSRGSVIPLFKQQIAAGGPVTVTHPEMTRYFMTIPEAARLVLQASALAHEGEVFVLDMGEPVKILDLAKQLIRLSGYQLEDIEIQYTGIRPGEKLYEELLNKDEIHPEQVYEKIYRGKARSVSAEEMNNMLDTLQHHFSKEQIIAYANNE